MNFKISCRYELGKPRYNVTECRQLRLTYGRPLPRVTFRLNKEQPIEEEVYLGDIPIMIGGGEFIINDPQTTSGGEPVAPALPVWISSRPPTGQARNFSCRIIPSGSWIELNVSKRGGLGVGIDQSGKFYRHDPPAGDRPELLDRCRPVATLSTITIKL